MKLQHLLPAQTAMATALSAIGLELAALEQRRKKTRPSSSA